MHNMITSIVISSKLISRSKGGTVISKGFLRSQVKRLHALCSIKITHPNHSLLVMEHKATSLGVINIVRFTMLNILLFTIYDY